MRCFAREGGEANGVHHHYFHFDFAARARNKKRLAAPFPNGSASLIVGGRYPPKRVVPSFNSIVA